MAPSIEHEFVELWTKSARRVFAFVLTLLPDFDAAEEVLQETGVLAWEKRDQYVSGTDFLAWSCRIAFFKVQEFRRRESKNVLQFSQPLLDAIDRVLRREQPNLEGRGAALVECLEKLPSRDRDLVRRRYFTGLAVRTIASQLDRSADAIYKALRRIHESLFECVESKMARSE